MRSAQKAEIPQGGIIAIVREKTFLEGLHKLEEAETRGFHLIEITATTPDFPTLTREARLRFPFVGLGTVRTREHLDIAALSGVDAVFSPGNPGFFIEEARKRNLQAIPGVATPDELSRALDGGADFCKVFPVKRLGGPAFVRDLLAPFPDARLIGTGGVSMSDADSYFHAGARAVGISRFDP